jgi:hypothetical protein
MGVGGRWIDRQLPGASPPANSTSDVDSPGIGPGETRRGWLMWNESSGGYLTYRGLERGESYK